MIRLPLIALVACACACAHVAATPDRSQIARDTKAANDESLRGHVERDVALIAAVYTDDAVVLPPGGVAPIVGLESIKRYYQKGLEGDGRTLKITTQTDRFEVFSENDALELGRYVITFAPSSTAAPQEVRGEMLISWKRIDGRWKIAVDMWH